MALPASGPISLSDVNVELGLSATAQISLNDAAVRTLFGVAGGAISMSDGYGKANEFAFTISANTSNANLATLATAAGWNGSSKLVVTINSGINISGNSTGTPALTISGPFPGGVEVINNGFIVGRGGNGGNGSITAGGNGGSGGLALSVSSAVTITNNGTIAGGGGGGGAGRGICWSDYPNCAGFIFGRVAGGGGGGGRSSLSDSSGGSGAAGQSGGSASAPGGAGTNSNAGSGGIGGSAGGGGNPNAIIGGTGGSGGGRGAAGGNGTGGGVVSGSPSRLTFFAQGSGGAAGAAISGNSNITYLATGTRLGAIT